MIRVVVLGSSAAMPSPERNLPGIAIRYKGDVYLFDCGEGSQRQMMKFKVGYGSVKGIFVSHLHPDHYLGIPGLLYTLEMNGREQPLYIFGPKGFGKVLKGLLNGKIPSFVELEEYGEGVVYRGNGFSVSAVKVNHPGNAYGFIFKEDPIRKFYEEKAKGLGVRGILFRKIQKEGQLNINGRIVKLEEVSWLKKGIKIAYSGDTTYCKKFVNIAKDSDLMIHDGTFIEEHVKEAKEKYHATVGEAAQAAKDSGAKQLIVTHISPRYKEDSPLLEEGKRIFDNLVIAKDGLTLEI